VALKRTTIVQNKKDKLVSIRIQSGCIVCIDYWKLNKATKKDHLPLLIMDQMSYKLVDRSHYCFVNGYSGSIKVLIAYEDKKGPHLPISFALILLQGCILVYVILLVHFKDVWWAFFLILSPKLWKFSLMIYCAW